MAVINGYFPVNLQNKEISYSFLRGHYSRPQQPFDLQSHVGELPQRIRQKYPEKIERQWDAKQLKWVEVPSTETIDIEWRLNRPFKEAMTVVGWDRGSYNKTRVIIKVAGSDGVEYQMSISDFMDILLEKGLQGKSFAGEFQMHMYYGYPVVRKAGLK